MYLWLWRINCISLSLSLCLSLSLSVCVCETIYHSVQRVTVIRSEQSICPATSPRVSVRVSEGWQVGLVIAVTSAISRVVRRPPPASVSRSHN